MTFVSTSSTKELTVRFAQLFSEKNVDAIGELLQDNFAMYYPALKWLCGKENVLAVLKKQFKGTKNISYEVINAYEDGHVGIIEFRISLDHQVLYGVDFIEWEKGKMKELRCYY